jgi:hypothetical protein
LLSRWALMTILLPRWTLMTVLLPRGAVLSMGTLLAGRPPWTSGLEAHAPSGAAALHPAARSAGTTAAAPTHARSPPTRPLRLGVRNQTGGETGQQHRRQYRPLHLPFP